MQLDVINHQAGAKASKVDVAEVVFAHPFNEGLVHQVVTAYLAGARAGTKAQKTKAEVRGGGKKPWKQKGTGRARAGSIRSPLWRGGGKTFAAKPRSHEQKVNRTMYRSAIRSILSELVRQDRFMVIDELQLVDHKTKSFIKLMGDLKLEKDVLFVVDSIDENAYLASRNLIGPAVIDVHMIDPVSLLHFEKVIFTVAALKLVEERLA